MTHNERTDTDPHVATALQELGEQLFTQMERLRDPVPGSELAELANLHPGAKITVVDSLASAMDAVSCTAHTLGFLMENQSATKYEPTHAGLIRQMLIGTYTISYVLGPRDPVIREERARILIAAEYDSLERAAKRAAEFTSREFREVKLHGNAWATKIVEERTSFGIAKNLADKTGSIAVKGSEEFIQLLVAAHRDREDVTEDERERALLLVPDAAAWAWQITSGFAHAYDWPYRITLDGDIQLLLPPIIEAIRISGMLCGLAALTSRENFHGFHELMRGGDNNATIDADPEIAPMTGPDISARRHI